MRAARLGCWPLLVVVLGCGPQPAARGADLAQARQEIEGAIQLSIAATRAKDIDAYMRTFAPGLAILDERGDTISVAEQRANTLRDWSIIVETTDITMVIDSLAVAGDSATVFTAQRWARLMLQRDGITRDTVVTTQDHREAWVHTRAGWKQARVEELGGTITINGRPYTP